MTFPAELKAEFIRKLKKHHISYSVNSWSNYMGTVANQDVLMVEVDNAHQAQIVNKILAKLNANRLPGEQITKRCASGWEDKLEPTCCFFPWKTIQERRYNESFSFSEVVGGKAQPQGQGTDIVQRFSKNYQFMKVLGPIARPEVVNPNSPIHRLQSYAVQVSAGVQVSKFVEYLRKKNLSLSTVSMISEVTPIGLTGTAGHGTGRDEPAFNGLIMSVTICDMDGNIREISHTHPDFKTLMGAHCGMLGDVLAMTFRVYEAFNLEETIDLYHNAKAMTGRLQDVLSNNQYISIMGTPTYSGQTFDKVINKWQIRKWNHSALAPTVKEEAPYAPNATSLSQELEVRFGSSIMEHLLDSELIHLMPYFMTMTAAIVTGSRGTKSKIDYENHIVHPQVGFPKLMRDVSYLIPVKDSEAGQKLETILQGFEALIEEAGQKGVYPITYAIYVRYIKGTNGGLSTSFTNSDDERILAIDMVTHPHAPGIRQFEKNFVAFLRENNFNFRNHLGKNFPEGVERYTQFLGAEKVDDFIKALERWYCETGKNNGVQRLASSPYLTPYYRKMLYTAPELNQELVVEGAIPEPSLPKKSAEECRAFLSFILNAADSLHVFDEAGEEAKKAFVSACQKELDARQEGVLVMAATI